MPKSVKMVSGNRTNVQVRHFFFLPLSTVVSQKVKDSPLVATTIAMDAVKLLVNSKGVNQVKTTMRAVSVQMVSSIFLVVLVIF